MDPRSRYDDVVDELLAVHGDLERATMMGMPSLKRNGKLVAGFWKDAMVFKLPDPEARERALALAGAALFDPSEQDRPMREWVAVPAAHAERWRGLAEEALGPPAG